MHSTMEENLTSIILDNCGKGPQDEDKKLLLPPYKRNIVTRTQSLHTPKEDETFLSLKLKFSLKEKEKIRKRLLNHIKLDTIPTLAMGNKAFSGFLSGDIYHSFTTKENSSQFSKESVFSVASDNNLKEKSQFKPIYTHDNTNKGIVEKEINSDNLNFPQGILDLRRTSLDNQRLPCFFNSKMKDNEVQDSESKDSMQKKFFETEKSANESIMDSPQFGFKPSVRKKKKKSAISVYNPNQTDFKVKIIFLFLTFSFVIIYLCIEISVSINKN